jgi:hypothetical protein
MNINIIIFANMKLLFFIVCALLIFQAYSRSIMRCGSGCKKRRKERHLQYLENIQKNNIENGHNMQSYMNALKDSCINNTTKTCSIIIDILDVKASKFEIYLNRSFFPTLLSDVDIKYHIETYLCASCITTHNEFTADDFCYKFNEKKINDIRYSEKIFENICFTIKTVASIFTFMTMLSALKS